jgi:hypothetical protein
VEVVNLTPLRVGSLVWQDERAGPTLTVVCKGTYRLLPGESELAAEQEPLYARDEHEGGDEARGVYAAADLVPRKPRADVLVVGHAYPPPGEAARSLVARVSIGGIDKEIEVFGDGGPIKLTGLGPVAASSPERRARLGKLAAARPGHLFDAPLPEGFDHGYFNAAPPDQQLPRLRDGERLILQGLHREHAWLLTVLHAARPRAFAERPGALPHEVSMRCDTLWTDTDRAIYTLTWRGQLTLASREEPGRVLVALEQPGAPLSHDDVIALVGPLSVLSEPLDPGPPESEPPLSLELEEDTDTEPRAITLTGMRSAMGGLRLASSRPVDPETASTSSSILAGARITSTKPSEPPPAAGPTAKAPPLPARRPVGKTLVTVPGAPAPPGPTWRDSVALFAPASPSPPPAPRFGSPPAAVPGRPREGDAIDLIWADPAAASKIRRAFGDLLSGLAPAAQGSHEAAAVRVLASGEQRDAGGLEAAMSAAVGPDAGFRAPPVLVAGELRFAFDEIETLRAVVSVARAFAAGDAALEEAIDAARALLAAPAIPVPERAARLARRVRDVFEGAARGLPQGFLDAQVERVLLARRAYERRAVFGGDRLRALVTLPGAEAACPVYLPEALANVLPMFPAFEAKVLAEAHAAQDAAEACPVALHALALARVVPAAVSRTR